MEAGLLISALAHGGSFEWKGRVGLVRDGFFCTI